MTYREHSTQVENAIKSMTEILKEKRENVPRKDYITFLKKDFKGVIDEHSQTFGISVDHLKNVGMFNSLTSILNSNNHYK